MFTSLQDFKNSWKRESEGIENIFSALTVGSLDQKIIEGQWTLGETAWHIVKTIPEMMGHTGLTMEKPCDYKSLEKNPEEILNTFRKVSEEFIKQLDDKWNDSTLQEEDNMYGEKWKKGTTLMVLIVHQGHHRGQMTVLMRQAGLKVPGVYGPAKEEWKKYGMEEPVV